MFRFGALFAALSLLASAASAQVMASGAATATRPVPGLLGGRASYSLTAGAMFAGRYGSASYLSPSVVYRLAPRFSVFGGITYLRTLPGAPYASAENGSSRLGLMGTNHYLVQAGGNYAVSPRLSLTGTAWKDLTPSMAGRPVVNPYAGFNTPGSGVNLRADFQISENVSVSGGVRVSSGAAPGNSMYYGPASGQPLGY
ncbi:hypothetical protein [Hymenobacter sp. DG25A]|uniref:hypothetical protein n=1 Tax=Hymenobacter sp. DG25A TaxID=1385663 RepID=UPI0006C8BD82|nr:hypothetical protein [Hymenobacter sp. DG25A]